MGNTVGGVSGWREHYLSNPSFHISCMLLPRQACEIMTPNPTYKSEKQKRYTFPNGVCLFCCINKIDNIYLII